jgi:DNA polymerase III sliding clamp (beta) subunit (PCNA family)
MKISKKCKVELIASKDNTRYVINNPYLQGDKLIATNGKSLVVLPVERDSEDTDGPINVEAFKLSRKVLSCIKDSQIIANGELKISTKEGQMTIPRRDLTGGNFPNWKQVIPNENRGGYKIGLNAEMLYDLAQSLGGNEVILEVFDEVSPIIVKAHPNHAISGSLGVLMPVKIKTS